MRQLHHAGSRWIPAMLATTQIAARMPTIVARPLPEEPSRVASDRQARIMRRTLDEARHIPPPPAKRLYVQHLHARSLKPTEAQGAAMCAVCITEFEPDAEVVEIPCHHVFCKPCIQLWLRRQGTCPVCRALTGVDDWEVKVAQCMPPLVAALRRRRASVPPPIPGAGRTPSRHARRPAARNAHAVEALPPL